MPTVYIFAQRPSTWPLAERLAEALKLEIPAQTVQLVDRLSSRTAAGRKESDLELVVRYGATNARMVRVVIVDEEGEPIAVWWSQPSVHDVVTTFREATPRA